jgi:predicted RNA-binding protein
MFLSAVLSALKKVVALSKAFSAFQESILENRIHSSIGETKKILEGVTEEVNCAMEYISHFSSPTSYLEGANINHVNKNALNRACTTIDAWNTIYKNGASMAMNENPDIQYMKRTNQTFIQQSAQLRRTTNIIRERYSYYF